MHHPVSLAALDRLRSANVPSNSEQERLQIGIGSVVNQWAKMKIGALQEYSLLIGRVLTSPFTSRRYWGDLFLQMDTIGVGSVPIILLTGFFTGGVLALQSASALRQFGALSETPVLVTMSVVKELGPVITALMVSGRNASGMASELGSMQITDQIDAMRALGTDPLPKLVVPRIFATVIMLFFLTILSDAAGMGGGAAIAVMMLSLDKNSYLHRSYQSLDYADVLQGLVKPVVFGFIIASIGCYFGLGARGGTQGVGKATTRAVVFSSVLIIVSDFLISRVMIAIFG